MLEQNDRRGAWCYRVWDGQLREAFDGPALPAVERRIAPSNCGCNARGGACNSTPRTSWSTTSW